MNHLRLAAPAAPAAFNDDFQGITMKNDAWPRLCRDCKHHILAGNAVDLRCIHPAVIARDPVALADVKPHGSSALAERQKDHAQCGMRGLLWEPITGAGA